MKELQALLEDEQRSRDEARDSGSRTERRVNELAAELDENKMALEQVITLTQYVLSLLSFDPSLALINNFNDHPTANIWFFDRTSGHLVFKQTCWFIKEEIESGEFDGQVLLKMVCICSYLQQLVRIWEPRMASWISSSRYILLLSTLSFHFTIHSLAGTEGFSHTGCQIWNKLLKGAQASSRFKTSLPYYFCFQKLDNFTKIL